MEPKIFPTNFQITICTSISEIFVGSKLKYSHTRFCSLLPPLPLPLLDLLLPVRNATPQLLDSWSEIPLPEISTSWLSPPNFWLLIQVGPTQPKTTFFRRGWPLPSQLRSRPEYSSPKFAPRLMMPLLARRFVLQLALTHTWLKTFEDMHIRANSIFFVSRLFKSCFPGSCHLVVWHGHVPLPRFHWIRRRLRASWPLQEEEPAR